MARRRGGATRSAGAAGTALGATAGPTPVAGASPTRCGRGACCLGAAGRRRRRRAASRSSQAAARARRRAGRSLPDRRCRVDARPGRRRARRTPTASAAGVAAPRRRRGVGADAAVAERPVDREPDATAADRPRDPPARRAARRRPARARLRGRAGAVGRQRGAGPAGDGAAEAAALGLDRDAVVLLAGGARGITARFAAALAAPRRCRIELLGRSPLPAGAGGPGHRRGARRGRAARPRSSPRRADPPAEIERGVRPDRAARGDPRHPRRPRGARRPVRYHSRRRPGRRRGAARSSTEIHAEHGRLDGVVHAAGVHRGQADRATRPPSPSTGSSAPRSTAPGRCSTRPARCPTARGSPCCSAASPASSATAARSTTPPPTTPSTSSAAAGRGPDRPRADRALGAVGAAADSGMVTPELGASTPARGIGLIDPEEGVAALLRELAWGAQAAHAGRLRRIRLVDRVVGRRRCTRDAVAIVGMAALLPGRADLGRLLARTSSPASTPSPRSRPARWDAGVLRPPTGRRRADRFYCRRGGFVDDAASSTPPRVRHHADLGRRAPSPTSSSPCRSPPPRLADAGGDDGAAGRPAARRRDPRPRRLPHARARPARPAGAHRRPAGPHAARAAARPRRRTARRRSRPRSRRSSGPERPEAAIGLVPNLAASRIANRLDLRGPAYTVDAACASLARRRRPGRARAGAGPLRRGARRRRAPLPRRHALERVLPARRAVAAAERIRPFDRDADGILIGEGTGVVVLKRLADAERDGDRIYAVIRGTGVASDGRAAEPDDPDPRRPGRAPCGRPGAARARPARPDASGCSRPTAPPPRPATRPSSPPCAEVFGPDGRRGPRAVVGSVKSMIGHAMPAAGVAGLIKAALAVHHGVLPPTLHCDDPHPELARTRFRPLDRRQPWERPATGAARAGVNAFGFGGINAHVVLERRQPRPARLSCAPARRRARRAEPERVLRLAADSPEALAGLLDADDRRCSPPVSTRAPRPASRPGWASSTPPRSGSPLARQGRGQRGAPWRGRNDVWFSPAPLWARAAGKLAFVFPGLEADFEPRVTDMAAHFGLAVAARAADAEVGDVGRHGPASSRSAGCSTRRCAARHRAGRGRRAQRRRVDRDGRAAASTPPTTSTPSSPLRPGRVRVPGVVFGALGTAADVVLAELSGTGLTSCSRTTTRPPVDGVRARGRRRRVGAGVPGPRSDQPGAALPLRLPHTDAGALPRPDPSAGGALRAAPADQRPSGRPPPRAVSPTSPTACGSCSSGICWNRYGSGS